MLYPSHWWGDGGALEGAKDEEEAGGQGDRELRHEPGDCDHDDLHHVDNDNGEVQRLKRSDTNHSEKLSSMSNMPFQ